MSRQERRTLRAIAEALTAEDPALASLLSTSAEEHRNQMLRGIAGAFVGVSLALLVPGLILNDLNLLIGAFMVLISFPVTFACIAAATGLQQ
nr:DUF3040 domain-containing protein [Pseudonocardia acidicola]